jgi:hypothetical protein
MDAEVSSAIGTAASLLVLTGFKRTRRIIVEPELVGAIVALNVTRRAQEMPKIAVIRT